MMANAAEWTKRVRAWRASGLSAGQYAEGRGFAEGTLRWWAWRVGQQPEREGASERVRLLRVVRRSADSEPRPSSAGSPVTIELGAARVSVSAGFDRATLHGVLDVLRAFGAERDA